MADDRKQGKSQKAMQEAYARLCRSVGYENITVGKLCKEADVNRSTFYRHYQNLEDFLLRTQEQLSDDLIAAMSVYQFDTNITEAYDRCFSLVLEQADTVFAILFRPGGPGFSQVSQGLRDQFLPAWQRESTLPPEQLELIYVYCMDGSASFLHQWWRSGFSLDKQTALKLFEDLVKYGLYNFVYTV